MEHLQRLQHLILEASRQGTQFWVASPAINVHARVPHVGITDRRHMNRPSGGCRVRQQSALVRCLEWGPHRRVERRRGPHWILSVPSSGAHAQ
jgi:hypothetical protein